MSRKTVLVILFIVFVAVDQLSKWMVQSSFELYESAEVIPGLFNITYMLNPGAAFGMFQHQPEIFRRIFFITVTIAACVLILVLLYREFEHKLRSFAYVMVLAGAVGNLIDRVRLDRVVDFLDVYYQSYHWYTFNFADSLITVGVILLVIDMAVLSRKKGLG